MKHINEPPPSLVEQRPDVPLRLAAAVDRALEKDPRHRFPSMDDFAAELEACLKELGNPDAEATFIAPSHVVRGGGTRRARARRRSWWPLLFALLGAAAVAAVVAGVLALGGSKEKPGASGGPGPTVVHLTAVKDFDPYGGDGEHPEAVARATDGDPNTYWYTQHYFSEAFGGLKSGLGLVVDAGRSVKLGSLTVHTPTPGFVAQIRAGNSRQGPFADDSASPTVNSVTTFHLTGKRAQYYVVWITRLPPGGKAEISEVTSG